MRANGITCADAHEGDLDARYAANQLSEEEAEAFEEHFFGCDGCWTRVQRAIEIRAAEGSSARVPIAPRKKSWRTTGPSHWLALAATVLVLVVGTWRVDAWRRPGGETGVMRAPTDSLHVVTQTRGMTLIASWARTPEAKSYRVRLYSAAGTVLHQREVADTTIALAAASLPRVAPDAPLYWEIQALSRVRQVLARSGLRAVRFPRVRG